LATKKREDLPNEVPDGDGVSSQLTQRVIRDPGLNPVVWYNPSTGGPGGGI
jgi:hypothetical protein